MGWEGIKAEKADALLAHMGCCISCLPALPASQLGLQFGSHFLPPGQRGPCKSENSWASLGARKAERMKPFRSEDHKAVIESPLVSSFEQSWLLSGPIINGFFPSLFLGCAMIKQLANQTTDSP